MVPLRSRLLRRSADTGHFVFDVAAAAAAASAALLRISQLEMALPLAALLQVRRWPAWKCVQCVENPSYPGTLTPATTLAALLQARSLAAMVAGAEYQGQQQQQGRWPKLPSASSSSSAAAGGAQRHGLRWRDLLRVHCLLVEQVACAPGLVLCSAVPRPLTPRPADPSLLPPRTPG